jgi:flagellin
MGIYLASNAASLNALNNLSNVTRNLSKSLERLSSGSKLNRASDGAASLLASENLRSQIRGSNVAMSNVQQGISMLQTADGALRQSYDVLQRMRELAIEGSSTTADGAALNAEFQELITELDNISDNTSYNGNSLLDGSIPGAGAFNIIIDANGTAYNISSAFADSDATALAVADDDVANAANAATALTAVDAAMSTLATRLADIGGHDNTLTRQLNTLSISMENMTAAESNIRNTDVAAEMSNLTRLQILQQASASALAQANQLPSIAMRFLQ